MREKLWKRVPADADADDESGKAEDAAAEDAATNDQEAARPHDTADADEADECGEDRLTLGTDAGETFPIVSRELEKWYAREDSNL
jgi:hypothetical protein